MRPLPRRSLLTHALALSLGAGGAMLLCPDRSTAGAASSAHVADALRAAPYQGHFHREQPGSSAQYWAQGEVGIDHGQIAFNGKLSVPASAGPSLTIYLSSDRITDSSDFLHAQPRARRVGLAAAQSRFLVSVPHDIDVDEFTTVVLWSDRDQQLVSVAQYRNAWDDDHEEAE